MSGPQTTSHSQTHARSDKKMIMCETGIVVKNSSQQEACNPAKKRKKIMEVDMVGQTREQGLCVLQRELEVDK